MPTTLVEHEAEGKAPAQAAEPQRREGILSDSDSAGPMAANVATARPALLHPRLLLGLQARAGNAAVADLIARSHQPEPVQAPERPTSEPVAVETQTVEASPPETPTAVPRAGESDDELAALDTAADAPPAGAQPEATDERALVAEDAQAELADQAGQSQGEPETSGGPVEPGAPIEVRPPPTVPDVSGAAPAIGLARVGSLPPSQLLSSLTSVSIAADRQASHEHERLAASPPQRPRHPGAPSTVDSPASTRIVPAEQPPTTISAPPEGRDVEIRRPIAPPTIPEVPFHDGQLPTRDPGLELKPGPLPHLPLEGSADPASVQRHRAHLRTGLERERSSGQQEAAQPLGEDEIFPTVPAETLRAAVAQSPGANGHAAGAPDASADDQATSIIAEQEKGAEIQGAVSAGLSSLGNQREDYAQRTAGERAKSDAEMKQLEQTNSQEQTGERAAAKREVLATRRQWSDAQQEVVAGAQSEADAKTSETVHMVAQERAAADQAAAAHYQEGQAAAEHARHEGEQQAAAERQKAQSQSPGGLLGAIGSAAQSLFDKAKHAVQSVFDRARQLVRGAIEKAQQLATAVMERARQTIVGAIRAAGSVLMAIGDRVLVALPALRTRFRKAIQDRIAAAEAAVNKLASGLKQAVQVALNLLGTALSAAIGLFQKGMQAAVDGVRSAVQGALAFARGALAAFGTFAVLVKDIAANPGQWISNLAAGVRDGIRNYLWIEIKTAVQGWFSDKVQEVVGVGQAIWHLLQRGGISIVEIARMAWEGLKAAIPGILLALLIEKLMSLIVPAVGAIITIIQSIQAAWGSLGRILQAFEAFFAFLKQVKLGTAGPQFAKAVAAGAIAAVEFVSNFLMSRLKGAASSVSNRLRAIAKRIGDRLAAVGRGLAKGARAIGSGIRRVGQKVRSGFDRLRGKRPKSHADQERQKRERQEAAFVATKSKLDALFSKGVSRARLVAEVGFLRLRYRWGTLKVQGAAEAHRVSVIGGFSPIKGVTEGRVKDEAQTLEQFVSRYPKAKRKLQQVRDDPFIDSNLKVAWMREVETRLRKAGQLEEHPNPYSVMVKVAAANRANFFLGRRIEVEEIVKADGLLKYVDVRDAFSLLKPELIAEYAYPVRWVRKIAAQQGLVSVADFAPGNEVPGHFWSAFRDAVGAGELALKHMRLQPKDYPRGAIRFVLPKEGAAIPELHKPTAFDGMFFPKWAATEPRLKWGLVPPHEASRAGIREGVSRTQVPISSTILHEYVPPGVYR